MDSISRRVIKRSVDGSSSVYEPVDWFGFNNDTLESPLERVDAFLMSADGQSVATSQVVVVDDSVLNENEHFLVESAEGIPTGGGDLLSELLLQGSCEGLPHNRSPSPEYSAPPSSMSDPLCFSTNGSTTLSRSINSPNIFYWRGSLRTLSFSTDGLFRIVSGPVSSSDFSEMFVGSVLSCIYGKLSIAGIDKTLPRAMRSTTNQASGVPDLYMVARGAPGDNVAASADKGRFIVSVKRFFVYDDRIHRVRLAQAILKKAFAGMQEYLEIVPLPGERIVIVLVAEVSDARILNSVFAEFFPDVKVGLYIIVITERGELHRLVFRYTADDAAMIKEMFEGRTNLDFVEVPDVPWLSQRSWFANPEEEEDFEYVDLVEVFGEDFFGGT